MKFLVFLYRVRGCFVHINQHVINRSGQTEKLGTKVEGSMVGSSFLSSLS